MDKDLVQMIVMIVLTLMIILVNLTIIIWIKVSKDKTLIDNMILLDCLANIALTMSMASVIIIRVWDNDIICLIKASSDFFFSYINRMIPLAIVGYRYILVCHVDVAERIGNAKLGNSLIECTIVISILLTAAFIFFAGDTLPFLVCQGREESFYYEFGNFYQPPPRGFMNKLDIYHPSRIFGTISLCAFIFVVPFGYYKIYKFLENHNNQQVGEYNVYS